MISALSWGLRENSLPNLPISESFLGHRFPAYLPCLLNGFFPPSGPCESPLFVDWSASASRRKGGPVTSEVGEDADRRRVALAMASERAPMAAASPPTPSDVSVDDEGPEDPRVVKERLWQLCSSYLPGDVESLQTSVVNHVEYDKPWARFLGRKRTGEQARTRALCLFHVGCARA